MRADVPLNRKVVSRLPRCGTLRPYGGDEESHWTYEFDTDVWSRAESDEHVEYVVRVQVRRSTVDGLGLFTTRELPRGAFIGRVTGTIVAHGYGSTRQASHARLPAHVLRDRVIVLEECGTDETQPSTYCVVDTRHAAWPFEFVNAGTGETNVEVDPLGHVTTTRRIPEGGELLWDYGDAFVLERR